MAKKRAGFGIRICQPITSFISCINCINFYFTLSALMFSLYLLATVVRIPKCHFCLPSPSFFCVVGEVFCFLHSFSALAVLLFGAGRNEYDNMQNSVDFLFNEFLKFSPMFG